MRAIDADALITDCKKYLSILNPDRDGKEYARIFWLISILRNAPTIEAERKKGRWIVYYECPKCGEITKNFMEYCPFCGADMTED